MFQSVANDVMKVGMEWRFYVDLCSAYIYIEHSLWGLKNQ